MNATNVAEVADGIFRIHTPVATMEGGFSFNQYLVVDEKPLLFHTGPRRLFSGIRDAVARVIPLARLRYVAFSHYEADECGALNDWLAVAPEAEPVCSRVAAMTSIEDMADRPPIPQADGDRLRLGRHVLRWIDAPHVPHGWDCGFMYDDTTSTLLCGDLFTQPGEGKDPLTDSDILGPSEALRQSLDYYSHGGNTRLILTRMAALNPTTLACMHGSAWHGDGSALLMALADAIDAP